MNKLITTSLLFLTIFISFPGCQKDDPAPPQVTSELVMSVELSGLQSMMILSGYSDLANQLKYSVDVYKITCKTNHKGKTIDASGLVCLPKNSAMTFPVLSFQHGTMVAKNEAPTLTYLSQTGMAISAIAAAGYVVSYPDLIGFGESSGYFHPYYIKESNVQAVTDMLDAVKSIDKSKLSNVSINDSLFLAGYSQGGWITLAVMDKLEHSSNTTWDIIATSCGAGPYNPQQVMDYAMSVEEYEHPYYMGYVLLSFVDRGLLDNNMGKYIQEPYASLLPGLFDGINSGSQIDAQLTKVPSEFYTSDFKNNYTDSKFDELRLAFETNRTKAWKNTSPLLLLHGADDIYIPRAVTDSIYADFISAGSQNVNSVTFPGYNHNTAAIPSIIYSLTWFSHIRSGQEVAVH
jgi:pimeloyl-ACP methyl ester carboxylesterase